MKNKFKFIWYAGQLLLVRPGVQWFEIEAGADVSLDWWEFNRLFPE